MSSITFNQQARDFWARKKEQHPELNQSAEELFEDLVREGRSDRGI